MGLQGRVDRAGFRAAPPLSTSLDTRAEESIMPIIVPKVPVIH